MNKSSLVHAFYGAVACVLFTAGAALAQPGSGGPVPGTPPNPTPVPIDGGVSLLLAAGGAYGLKRLRAARAKK
ncbi:PID-CTERM protein-sorting domain-containing protein [Hymenobacter glacialis]|uniref:VPDSG-CTERM protein sorting domain-containing protein n=1 Tax=Hymenobacter glacialis TaxID=1908236 RepID=A0A1G1T6A0_9BACT|nr:hypothetical protein [Hymenobacter glacialis]OGX86408.1 hypothetical protein BEN48_13075 [Hymenobacter glacialis]